ncbi:WD40 repeat domain-containing protein [Aeoliella sp.]|uniref:WD40 repeat domain-containing protein n=1 Tax=Aeoliella sp. TaxID=2795800 RepID=UPI003CCB7FB3
MSRGTRLFTSTPDGLFVWDVLSGNQVCAINDLDEGSHQAISALDVSPCGRWIATGVSDLTTKVYDAESGERKARLSKLRKSMYNSAELVRFSPAGDVLACAMGRKVELYSVADWQQVGELKGHTSKVHLMEFVPESNTLITCGGKYIKVWDTAKGAEVASIAEHQKLLGSLAVSPDGKFFVSGGEDNRSVVWSLPNATKLADCRDHASYVFQLAISLDGSQIASGEYKDRLCIRDRSTGELVGPPLEYPARSLAYSPSGQLLAVAGSKTSTLVNAAEGEVVAHLPGSLDVQFSEDSKLVAICDENDVVLLEINS